MKTAFITGANKSIGFETARQLLQQDYFIYLGARDVKKGAAAVAQLEAEGLHNVCCIEIDVDNAASITAARKAVGEKTEVLDVLINNAGISGGLPQPPLEVDTDVVRKVFETNVFGVIGVTQAFIDLLQKSAAPRIVNVTSGLGSLALHNDPEWKYYNIKPTAYVASKAALNAYTIVLAHQLKDTAFKINSVDPGYTATDFNNHSGPGTVVEAAAHVVRAATLDEKGLSGQFFSEDNAPETGLSPW